MSAACQLRLAVACLLTGTAGAFRASPPAMGSRVQLKPSPVRILYRVRGGSTEATMSAISFADRFCPAMGFLLSNALYLSPLPETLRRVKAGSLGELNPLPTSLMVVGTIAWLSYAMSARNPWIAATNVPGAVVAIGTFVFLLPLLRPGPQLKQVQATVIAGATSSILLWTYLIFMGATAVARSKALGIYATGICIALFASPLSTIATVVRERNAASILAPLTAAQCLNCLMWTTYGVLAAKDPFVWGPNGTGLILGLIQLALKLAFPSKQ